MPNNIQDLILVRLNNPLNYAGDVRQRITEYEDSRMAIRRRNESMREKQRLSLQVDNFLFSITFPYFSTSLWIPRRCHISHAIPDFVNKPIMFQKVQPFRKSCGCDSSRSEELINSAENPPLCRYWGKKIARILVKNPLSHEKAPINKMWPRLLFCYIICMKKYPIKQWKQWFVVSHNGTFFIL